MDYENERILKLIFPDGIPAQLQSDPAAIQAYLFKLGTYKVDQLKHEQSHLAAEHRSVLEQTQDLAISNYTTFIRTSECSKHIFAEFSATEQQLDTLIERLPDLSGRCEQFVAASANINSARRLNTLTLRKNAQLLEILELPQLMDTCIRHGKYEEALELAAYVQRLGARHSAIPVINNIVAAIEASWHTMLKQLLAQLRADLQLPQCLQVVGYLRRMQAFSAAELRLVFLQSRDAWLQRILAAIPVADPLHHLTKTVELTRVNLFTIVTQYKATFADDIGTASAAEGVADEAILSAAAVATEAADDGGDGGGGAHVFHSWLTAKIDRFLRTLTADLEAGAGADSIDTVLGQCMYFGLSFSRVGVDFRGLMAPIFAAVIRRKFESSVLEVSRQFEQDMEHFTLINKTTFAPLAAAAATAEAAPLRPPDSLLDFQPLAVLCNGLLGALNDLRCCSPVALAPAIRDALQGALHSAAQAVHSFHRQEQQAFGGAERENFQRMASALCAELVPFVQRCLLEVFPAARLQAHLGLSAAQLQREGLTALRVAEIVQPLVALLPVGATIPVATIPVAVAVPERDGGELIESETVGGGVLVESEETDVIGAEVTSTAIEDVKV